MNSRILKSADIWSQLYCQDSCTTLFTDHKVGISLGYELVMNNYIKSGFN